MCVFTYITYSVCILVSTVPYICTGMCMWSQVQASLEPEVLLVLQVPPGLQEHRQVQSLQMTSSHCCRVSTVSSLHEEVIVKKVLTPRLVQSLFMLPCCVEVATKAWQTSYSLGINLSIALHTTHPIERFISCIEILPMYFGC